MADQERDYAYDEEPIFWTSTRPGFNDQDRMRQRIGLDGTPITEKHPQIGHVGDIKVRKRAPGVRFVYMIDHHGNEIALVLTNAAAHLDSTGPFAQYQLMKARFLGWFSTGDCPCALLGTGRLKKAHIVAKEIIDQDACAPGQYNREDPCPHTRAEWKARQDRKFKQEAEREAKAKDIGQKMIEEQRSQTEQLVNAIRDLVPGATSGKGKQPKGE